MLVIGITLLLRHAREAETVYSPKPLTLVLASGAGVGLLTGVLGVGGGFLVVPGAVLIPLGQLSARVNELDPEKPVAVICASGNRSQSAAALLALLILGIPASWLSSRNATASNSLPRDQEIVVICHSGNRSAKGREILLNAGFPQVTSMAGGLIQWQAAGYPTVSGA